jgi:hypothetical protein
MRVCQRSATFQRFMSGLSGSGVENPKPGNERGQSPRTPRQGPAVGGRVGQGVDDLGPVPGVVGGEGEWCINLALRAPA